MLFSNASRATDIAFIAIDFEPRKADPILFPVAGSMLSITSSLLFRNSPAIKWGALCISSPQKMFSVLVQK